LRTKYCPEFESRSSPFQVWGDEQELTSLAILTNHIQKCLPLWSSPAFRIIPDIISDRLTNDLPPSETSDFQPKTIIVGKIGAEREMTAGKCALVVLSGFEQGANVDFMAVVDDNGGGHKRI
jgi:hypothetical protein